MKTIIILTILIGLFFGYWLSLDPGYVLLSWYEYTFESSLWLFIALLFISILSLYLGISFILFVLKKGFSIGSWRSDRKSRRAQEDTTQGLIYLADGQWDKAERILTRNAQFLKKPLVNYLAAARAAQEKSDFKAADEWLEKAAKSTKSSSITIGIAKADSLLSRNHDEQALAVLLELHKRKPEQAYTLKLLVQVYEKLQDWSALYDLLPLVRKHTNINQERLSNLEQKVHIQLLERAAREDKQNPKELKIKRFFSDLSRSERYNLDVLRRYLELLIELGKENIAEDELKLALKHIWHDDLVEMYGKLKGENSKAQFLFAEQKLKERPNDPILLLTVARLALKNNNLKKARAYTETGLRIRSLPSLQAEMGKILALEGNKSAACDYLLKSVDPI